MTSGSSPFHIQQNTTPNVLRAILLSCGYEQVTISELAETLDMNVGTIQHIIPFIRQSGLLSSKGKNLILTELGKQFLRLNEQIPALFPEAMHHLFYTLHNFDQSKRFSWAYARLVNALWSSCERRLDKQSETQLVGMIIEDAAQTLGVPVDQIAFSLDSIRGALNWLRSLDPPVVVTGSGETIFQRRYFCSAFVFLWAVDFFYRQSETPYGVRMFLTTDLEEQLCRICVLDQSGLDNVLMMTKRTTDYEKGGFFDYGTQGGFGKWILLAYPCSVPTIPEGDH